MDSSWTVWNWICYFIFPSTLVAIILLKTYSETFQQWWYNTVSIRIARMMGMGHSHSHQNHSHKQGHGHGHSHNHSHQDGHGQIDDEVENTKRVLFKDLDRIASKSEELRKKGSIRILEIGTGYGANFKYYPENCHLIALDAFDGYKEQFLKNLSQFPGIYLEKFIHRPAEDMEGVDCDYVDIVIGTAVFCQVKDMQKVFNEIQRVLVPGGRFYYMDHIAAEPNTLTAYLQTIITPFAKFFLGGHLDRKIDLEILKAGFTIVEQKYVALGSTSTNWFSKLGQRHVVGVALK